MSEFFIIAVTAAILLLFFIVNRLVDRIFPDPKARKRRNMRDPKTQLDAISKIDFHRTPLMNRGEYRVFAMLEAFVARERRGHRVMVQVNLGEIIRPDPAAPDIARDEAFAAINSKRIDMVVINAFGEAVLAVEVQGSGHHLGQTAFMRDAVKREALRRAGVHLLEIRPADDRTEIEAQLRTHLDARAADGPRRAVPNPGAVAARA